MYIKLRINRFLATWPNVRKQVTFKDGLESLLATWPNPALELVRSGIKTNTDTCLLLLLFFVKMQGICYWVTGDTEQTSRMLCSMLWLHLQRPYIVYIHST
jgi:hypothetical protein